MIVPEIHPQPLRDLEDHEDETQSTHDFITKTFYGIRSNEAYTVSLLTVINGKVISYARKTILAGYE